MIALEKTFESGEGGFSQNPLTYTQVIRNENYAIYERSFEGRVKDYEVIKINIIKKGTVIFKKTIEDDTERYPGSSQWGHYAWTYHDKTSALNKYNELVNYVEPVKTEKVVKVSTGRRGRVKKERPVLKVPSGEFTIKALSEYNKVPVPVATLFVKESLEGHKIKFVKELRLHKIGKPSKVYQLVK